MGEISVTHNGTTRKLTSGAKAVPVSGPGTTNGWFIQAASTDMPIDSIRFALSNRVLPEGGTYQGAELVTGTYTCDLVATVGKGVLIQYVKKLGQSDQETYQAGQGAGTCQIELTQWGPAGQQAVGTFTAHVPKFGDATMAADITGSFNVTRE